LWYRDFPLKGQRTVWPEKSQDSNLRRMQEAERLEGWGKMSLRNSPTKQEERQEQYRQTDFENQLRSFLRSLGVPSSSFLQDYDFSSTDPSSSSSSTSEPAVTLVMSVPGYYSGEDIHRYGHMKVRQVLSQFPLARSQPSDFITYQVRMNPIL
jgi:hypothetical protein